MTLTWFGWVLLAYWILNVLASVWLVGRQREPITAGYAVIVVVIYIFLAWGLFAVGTGS